MSLHTFESYIGPENPPPQNPTTVPNNIDSLKTIVVFLAMSFAGFWRSKMNDGTITPAEGFQNGLQIASGIMPVIAAAQDVPTELSDGGIDFAEIQEIIDAVGIALPSDLSPFAQKITEESLLLLASANNFGQVVKDAIVAGKAMQQDPA